jgi:hypothetical protein
MDLALTCAQCGEVIGVYEPLVVVEDGAARQTSCAAEPQLLAGAHASCYHGDCHMSSGAVIAAGACTR